MRRHGPEKFGVLRARPGNLFAEPDPVVIVSRENEKHCFENETPTDALEIFFPRFPIDWMNINRPKRKRVTQNDLTRALHSTLTLRRNEQERKRARVNSPNTPAGVKRTRSVNASSSNNNIAAKRSRPGNASTSSGGNAHSLANSAISRRTVSTGWSTMSRGNIVNTGNLENTATSVTTLFSHQREAITIAKRSAASLAKVLRREKHAKGAPIYRGGLVAHSTGSGKTVTALGIILEYVKRQGMNEMNPYIFIVTTKSNKEQNGLEKYLKNIQTHFPDYAASLVPNMITGQEASAREAALAKGFSKHVKYQTFIEFASCLGLYGNRSRKEIMCEELQKDWKRKGLIVILDEAHELTKADLKDIKPFDDTKDRKNEYQAILQTKAFLAKQSGMGKKRPSSGRRSTDTANPLLHVYALTATPGTAPKQYIDTLNLVRPANAPRLSLNTYTSSKILHRFVSMADVSGNRKLFATVKDKTIITPILAEHYAIIMRKLGEFRKKQLQLKSEDIVPGRGKIPVEWKELHFLPYTEHDYLKRSKTLQNYLKETDLTMYGENRDEKFHMIANRYFDLSKRLIHGAGDKNLKARYSGKGSIFPGNQLIVNLPQEKSGAIAKVPHVITPKLVEVAHLAATCPGKQFIYTSDNTTHRLLTWLLQNLYDMTNITEGVRQGAITNKLLTDRLARMKKPSPFRNFIALPSNVGLSTVQNFMNGVDLRSDKTFEDATKERMRRNGQGQNCKILLVTGEMFTGVDINALRGVHLVEPFSSQSSHAQARGRASRAGGHAFLRESEQNAVVFHYKSKMVQYAGKDKNGGRVANMNVPANQNANHIFMQHVSVHHPKRALGTEGGKVAEGRQFVDGAVRRGIRNAVPVEGGANMMNRGQALFSTPDDLLDVERDHGKHARKMADFRQKFARAVKHSN